MYDNAWMEMRAEAHSFMKNKEENLIKKWLETINYKKPVGYYFDLSNKVVELYTTNPGILIGKAGIDIKRFQDMVSEEFFGQKWEVKLVEVRGGFVGI